MKLNTRNLPDLMFSISDVARTLDITPASARVLCSRYSQNGQLLRLRKNLYVLAERWPYLSLSERCRIANRIQVPSYVSLATALSYYELTEQLLRERVDSIARKRSIQYTVNSWQFNYHQIRVSAYNGFVLTRGFFIAEAEKALADTIYFCSFGRYAFDFQALEWGRIDHQKLRWWLAQLPLHSRHWWEKNGRI